MNVFNCNINYSNFVTLKLEMCRQPVTLIVDTGADISIIKENTMKPLENIYIDENCMINGVTDGKLKTIGCTYTNILINNYKIPQKFQAVTKDFPIFADGILGRDFLVNFECNICLKTWLLTFELNQEKFEIPIQDKFKENFIIPPRCQIIKQIKLINITEDSVILSHELKPGVFYSNALVNKDSQYVNIMNVNNSYETVSLNDVSSNLKILAASKFDEVQVNTTKQKQKRDKERITKMKNEISTNNVPSEARSELINLCEKYNDIFALENDTLSANNFYKQTINMENSSPVYIKNYRIPETHKTEVDKQVNKMLNENIIQHSVSPYNSPILLVPKKSNTNEKKWRLVVDFRQLNKKIIADKFPLPRIDEILDNLGRAKYFTTLDLMSGFHQIELDENSKQFTAFSSSSGHYEFNRLPFGLNISPNSFQRMMTIALSGLPPECAFLYIDDIIVVGCSTNHHLKNLEMVFDKLRHFNLKLNPSKCNFFKSDVTYLGHHISDKGILPDSSKYSIVEKYPIPTNSDDVRRFVAFCNYYRRFIQNFAQIAHPLNRLLRKSVKFNWTTECQVAFDTLKDKLLSPQILQFPDFKKDFVLITDASKVACGAILAQKYDDVELPIAFASKAFTRGESNKSTIEQELTAIHWAITHFRPYLFGRRFTVKTDHRPLVYLFSMKNPSSKLTRMRLDLEEFNFEVQYVKGKLNVGADALSRIKIDSETLTNLSVLKVTTRADSRRAEQQAQKQRTVVISDVEPDQLKIFESLNINEVYELPKLKIEKTSINKMNGITYTVMNKKYNKDMTQASFIPIKMQEIEKTLGTLLQKIEEKAKELKIEKIALALSSIIFKIIGINDFKKACNQHLRFIQIILYQPQREIDNTNEINEIIKINHDSAIGGHTGINRLYRKLKAIYIWPNMKKSITDYIKNCIKCKQNKHSNKTSENYTITKTPQKPFTSIALDTIGPFTKSNSENRYALTIQCDLSKYIIIKPIPDKQAETLAKAFIESCILVYGTPSIIRTDQGTEYKNEVFHKINSMLQITHNFSTPYHPQTIGSLERNHRCLNEFVRQFINESQSDWDDWLPYYAFCYNTTPHTDFPYTPFELIFGHTANLPETLRNPNEIEPIYNYDEYYTELKFKLKSAAQKTNELVNKIKLKRQNNQIENSKPSKIQIDDYVMLENHNRAKFDKLYKGPYKVIEINHPNITILDENNNQQYTVHKNNAFKYNN